ncbi:oxidoreductase [Streptomyces sp. NPDC091377]|uniref:oxidoreductase n=1 Tax=Streptomyces sp. NPDC091377 TaxID=3365995 RepID=UPI0038037A63
MLSYDDLTPPERALWDAFPERRGVDLRTGVPEDDRVAGGGRWGEERTVRAAVLTALLQEANPARPGAVAGLRLSGARITGALDLADAQLAHSLWIEDCWFEEGVDLSGVSAQSIVVLGSRVPGLEAGIARIEGRLDLRRSRFECGAVSPLHRKITALSLINTQVGGVVNLGGAEVIAPGEWAVSAGGLVAEGGLYCLDGFTAQGGLRFMGAQFPGGLHMRGARVSHPGPGGVALALDNAVASTLDFSDGFTADGTVRLRGARIADDLTFAGAILNGPPTATPVAAPPAPAPLADVPPAPAPLADVLPATASPARGPALAATRMQAVDFDLTLARTPGGPVDLRGAQVSHLHDNDRSWPDSVELDGFGYGSITTDDATGARREASAQRDSAARRVAWIRRGRGYSPQPYEQLAGWYRTAGHDDDARRVLLAKQRHRRRTLPPAARVWGHLLDATVGYGYRPWLAGVWLLALTALGSLAFDTHTPTPVKQGEGGRFQPFVYTLDLLIPIGGLGQRTAWYWDHDGLQALSYLLIAFGWILTTTLIAGVTRTLQKN